MASLFGLLSRKGPAARSVPAPAALPAWARPLFGSALMPRVTSRDGHEVLVWAIRDEATQATISEQFTSRAEDYHQRYAASGHFEKLFRQALEETGATIAPQPLILDLGSGSGANSVVPSLRLFPGARVVATDLSAELLGILALCLPEGAGPERVLCVQMDAMGDHVAPGRFDLVTGASILHHLLRPEAGIAAAARALKPGGQAIFFEPFDGWGIMRLAYERILAEAELRGEPLQDSVAGALRAVAVDIAARTAPDANSPAFAALDDKWLFSREHIEAAARRAGFVGTKFVPHNSFRTLYQATAAIQLRLATGLADLTLPDWAMRILESHDRALTGAAKRAVMLEGTIVLTK